MCSLSKKFKKRRYNLFKLYLLATSENAKLYIGISKSNIVNKIKILSSKFII